MKLFLITLITLPAYAGVEPIHIPKCVDRVPEYVVIADYFGSRRIVTSFHGEHALARCEYYIQQNGDPKFMYCLSGDVK